MAVTRVNGFAGAVSLQSGFNADQARWEVSASQPIEDDSSFSDTILGASHYGVGTTTNGFSCDGFGKSNAASTEPGIASHTAAGASITLTALSGCTFAGTGIMGDVVVGLAKRGLATCSYRGMVDGSWTPTWATS